MKRCNIWPCTTMWIILSKYYQSGNCPYIAQYHRVFTVYINCVDCYIDNRFWFWFWRGLIKCLVCLYHFENQVLKFSNSEIVEKGLFTVYWNSAEVIHIVERCEWLTKWLMMGMEVMVFFERIGLHTQEWLNHKGMEQSNLPSIETMALRSQLCWAGPISRRENHCLPKKALFGEHDQGGSKGDAKKSPYLEEHFTGLGSKLSLRLLWSDLPLPHRFIWPPSHQQCSGQHHNHPSLSLFSK